MPRFATANCRKKLVKARLRDCIFAFAALVGISSGSTQAAERVFVAGGSGRSGIEIVRVLAKSGYIVMASTRDAKRARERFGSDITWVEVDLLDPLAAREAVRGADIVVSALGHGDMVGVDSPQIVHDLAIRSLIDAAKTAGVKHMVLMSSSTAGHALDHRLEPRFGFVLHWMTKSEDYLISSGLPYTIIGPGGLVEGDLVFFANTFRPGLSHTGIYIGGGQFVHAENESTGVVVSDLNSDYYSSRWYGATRLA